MQFGALGSTVHRPEVTVKKVGGGGDGGGGGGGGEHTRQPDLVEALFVDHSIVPGPKMKLEGPPRPWKLVSVPDGWLGMRRSSA